MGRTKIDRGYVTLEELQEIINNAPPRGTLLYFLRPDDDPPWHIITKVGVHPDSYIRLPGQLIREGKRISNHRHYLCDCTIEPYLHEHPPCQDLYFDLEGYDALFTNFWFAFAEMQRAIKRDMEKRDAEPS